MSVRTKLRNMVYIVKGVDVWALSIFLPYLLEWWARQTGLWLVGYFTFVCGVVPKCIFGESPNYTYRFTYIVTLVPPDFSFFLFLFFVFW